MHPGWYPDPFSDGMLRWWDGTAWTARTMPNNPAPWAFRLDPQEDLRDERVAGRRASITVVCGAALQVLTSVLTVAVLAPWLRHLFDHLDDPNFTPDLEPVRFVTIQALGVVALVLQIMLMLWLYKAATLARRASVPSRRDPVWAFVGFFVPIVNFWFPYQVAAGCFPPGHALRRTAARWWTWNIVQSITLAAVEVAMFFSEPVAFVLCAAVALTQIMYAREARVLIAAVASVHTELVAPAP